MYRQDHKCSDVGLLPLKFCDVRTFLLTMSCLQPIGVILLNSFFLFRTSIALFLGHCVLSIWLFRKKQFLQVNPLYQDVRFPFCVQMCLLVPPCIYICVCVYIRYSAQLFFSACLCVYAPISSVISIRLSVCTCLCQISYISLPACLCMCVPVRFTSCVYVRLSPSKNSRSTDYYFMKCCIDEPSCTFPIYAILVKSRLQEQTLNALPRESRILTLKLLMSYNIYIYIYIWSTYSWCF